jgi:Tfp pilus assembly protein PilZ
MDADAKSIAPGPSVLLLSIKDQGALYAACMARRKIAGTVESPKPTHTI